VLVQRMLNNSLIIMMCSASIVHQLAGQLIIAGSGKTHDKNIN